MRRLASLLMGALVGCASGQGNSLPAGVTRGRTIVEAPSGRYDVTTVRTPDIASRTVAEPLEQAWGALPAVYEELGLSVKGMDAASHLIGTGTMMVHRSLAGTQLSKYLDCGYSMVGMPSANNYGVRLEVRTQLSAAADGGTLVRTLVEASAHDEGTSTNPVRCSTKGALEQRIAELLASGSA